MLPSPHPRLALVSVAGPIIYIVLDSPSYYIILLKISIRIIHV